MSQSSWTPWDVLGIDAPRPVGKLPSELTWTPAPPRQKSLGGRACAHCGELLMRRSNEHRNNWETRRFCNSTCANQSRVKATEDDGRECEYCGAVLVRRPREYPSNWIIRRFCGRRCRDDAQCVVHENQREASKLRMREWRQRKRQERSP